MVKNDDFLIIQGWMVNELHLKGNDLIIYAIIYSFNQEEKSINNFKEYLMEWTKSTKQGINKNLKSLVESNLIRDKKIQDNGINYDYFIVNKVSENRKQSFKKKTIYNNIYNTISNLNNISNLNINSINNNIYSRVIEHLNKRIGANYRASSFKTKRLIDARLRENYSLDDFKTVIDKKCVDWMNTDMQKYLRPETLFGTKFESYLNQPIRNKRFENPFMEVLRDIKNE